MGESKNNLPLPKAMKRGKKLILSEYIPFIGYDWGFFVCSSQLLRFEPQNALETSLFRNFNRVKKQKRKNNNEVYVKEKTPQHSSSTTYSYSATTTSTSFVVRYPRVEIIMSNVCRESWIVGSGYCLPDGNENEEEFT